MLKLNTKQQNLLTGLAIVAIGLIIVFVPTILKNERVLNFTTDTFNLVLLVVIGVILSMLNIRIGIVYAVLILSILSYSRLNGFMAPLTLTEEEKYDNQFVLPLEQVKSSLDNDNNYVNKVGIETFEDDREQYRRLVRQLTQLNERLQKEKNIKRKNMISKQIKSIQHEIEHYMLKNNINNIYDRISKINNELDETLPLTDTNEIPLENLLLPVAQENFTSCHKEHETFEDVKTTEPEVPTDLTTYYNNLESESLTNKLKTTNFNFDAVSCRYDGVQQHQNVTLHGPPLGWNATYTENVNGQLFYPLNG